MKDLNAREIGLLVPIMILIVWIGIRPGDFLKYSEVQVEEYLQNQMQKASEITAQVNPEDLPSWVIKLYDVNAQYVSVDIEE